MEPILEIKNLNYVYSAGTPFEHKALENVSFRVDRGEFIGIIGHTGSGKSTLMQQLNGLLKPTSGSVILDGQDIWSDKKLTRQARFRVGLVFQYPEYQLFEETVYRDIAFGPKNMGLSQEEVDRRVREAAACVGLTEKQLEVSPFDLSGGQKRRVAIAGVIAMEPEVLILDEPTAGLDPMGRAEILGNIEAYRKSRNATVMMVENSERFGLAQLHQLRGRVGRGKAQSYCIFMTSSKSRETRKRLEVLNRSNDGFYIASEDLKMRGPGDLFGIRQSGILEFRIGDVFQDAKVLQMAGRAADEFLERDPDLSLKEHRMLFERLERYLEKSGEQLNL